MSGHTIDIDMDEVTSQGDANGKVDNNTNANNTSNANNNSEVDNSTTVQRKKNRNNNNTNNGNNTSISCSRAYVSCFDLFQRLLIFLHLRPRIMCEYTIDIDMDEVTSQGDPNEKVDNNTNNANNTSNANTNSEVDNNTTVQIKKNRNNNATNNANNTSNANINNTNNTNNANINNINNTNSEAPVDNNTERRVVRNRRRRPKKKGSNNKLDYYINFLYKMLSFNSEPPKKQKDRKTKMKIWNSLAMALMISSVGVLITIWTCRSTFLANHEKLNQAVIFILLVFKVFIFSLGLFFATMAGLYHDRRFKITTITGKVLLLTLTIVAAGVVVDTIRNNYLSRSV